MKDFRALLFSPIYTICYSEQLKPHQVKNPKNSAQTLLKLCPNSASIAGNIFDIRGCILTMFSFSEQRQNFLAVLIGTAAFLSGCTQSNDQTGVIFRKAQEEEAAGGFKLAEQYYLACISSSLETGSKYYQLASVNRLTELEKKLNSPTRSKIYMNQAATLAEKSDGKSDKKTSEEEKLQLAQERHLALMRLADWLYEDGNFISARKLYEQAAELEKTFPLKSAAETTAKERIHELDKQAKSENDEIVTRLSANRFTDSLRGPAAAQRARDRHLMMVSVSKASADYLNGGDVALARKAVELLSQLRTIFGPREDEYRRSYREVINALIVRENFELGIPLVEADMKEFSAFTPAALEAAIPEAVENATFNTQDLLIMAEIRFKQKRYKEMLELCKNVETLAPKVIRENSPLQLEYFGCMALALEYNNQRTAALPFRKKHLEMFKKAHDIPMSYADLLHFYKLDLLAAGMNAEAETVADKILEVKKTVKGESNIVPSFLEHAGELIKNGKYEKARQVLVDALPHCRKYKNKRALLNCYTLLFQVCSRNHLQDAIEYSKCAEDMLRKEGDLGQKQVMVQALLTRATAETQLGQDKEALRTLDRAIDWQLSGNDELSAYTAALLNLKAQVLGRTADWEAEKKCRSQAIDVCRRINPPQPAPLASTLTQAALQYMKRKEYDGAENYLREAIRALSGAKNAEDKEALLNCKVALGSCLALAKKNAAESLSIKKEILPVYKSSFTNTPASDLSLCIMTAELCILLNDRANSKVVMNDAESIYAKHKDSLKAFEERMKKQRNILKTGRI